MAAGLALPRNGVTAALDATYGVTGTLDVRKPTSCGVGYSAVPLGAAVEVTAVALLVAAKVLVLDLAVVTVVVVDVGVPLHCLTMPGLGGLGAPNSP